MILQRQFSRLKRRTKALKEAEELAKNNDHITLDIYNNGFFTRNKSLEKLEKLIKSKRNRDLKRIDDGFEKQKPDKMLDSYEKYKERIENLKNTEQALKDYRSKRYFRNYDRTVATPVINPYFDKIQALNEQSYRKEFKKHGNILTNEQKADIIKQHPEATEYLKDQGKVIVKVDKTANKNSTHIKNKKNPFYGSITLQDEPKNIQATYFHEFGHTLNVVSKRNSNNRIKEEFNASSLLPEQLEKLNATNNTINVAKRYRTLQVGDGYITRGRFNGRRGAKKAGIDSEMMKDLRKMKKENKKN